MPVNRYRSQVEPLTGALRVVPPGRYWWYGAWSRRQSRRGTAGVDPATQRHYLVAEVRSRLYQQFYLPGKVTPARRRAAAAPARSDNQFARQLMAANQGTGAWQPGWTIVAQRDGAVRASRDGLTFWVPAAGWRPEAAPEAGAAVRLPQGARAQSPGFYLAQSDEPFAPSPADILVRLYWHVTPAGAIHLMSSVTESLNAARIPFQVKVLNDPNAYRRNDAGVLYITKRDLRRAAPLLASIYQDVCDELLPGEPALTKQLAPGLGLAEDPRDGDSFGLHRCGLLAEAFVEAAEQGIADPAVVRRVIEERFARDGLDLELPYLGPGSADDYAELLDLPGWQIAASPSVAVPTVDGAAPSQVDDPARRERLVAAARAIGDRLVADAVWYDGRCTWLGELGEPVNADHSDNGSAFGAIGPNLYDGMAGIALFLAQLFDESGDERYRRTALGALAQAARRAAGLPEGARLGFYSGWPGIAWTSARVGRLVGDETLALDLPRRLFDELAPAAPSTEPDLLSGSAGAILALLALTRMSGDERYLVTAVELGERLLAAATRDGRAMWWPIKLTSGRRALTGFAHGAAGIATALLSLFAATDEGRFAEAARAAFAFERRNFSARLGNWLDLRYPVVGPRDGPAAQATCAWCHGSGGIALSRLVAWQMLGDDVYLSEAQRALDTTAAWLETAPATTEDAWSLCHGLPGNADILLAAAGVLPAQAAALGGMAARVADAALAASEANRSSHAPMGADRPGLMLGLAGLGYFYLRLARPDTPSILLPLPDLLSR